MTILPADHPPGKGSLDQGAHRLGTGILATGLRKVTKPRKPGLKRIIGTRIAGPKIRNILVQEKRARGSDLTIPRSSPVDFI